MFLDRKREMSNPGAPGIILLHLVALSKKEMSLLSHDFLLRLPRGSICMSPAAGQREARAKPHQAKGLYKDGGSILHFTLLSSASRDGLKRFPSLRIKQSGNWAVRGHMSFDFVWLLLYLVIEEGKKLLFHVDGHIYTYPVISLELFKGKSEAQFIGKHESSSYTSYLRETACTKREPRATSLKPLSLRGKISRKTLQEP